MPTREKHNNLPQWRICGKADCHMGSPRSASQLATPTTTVCMTTITNYLTVTLYKRKITIPDKSNQEEYIPVSPAWKFDQRSGKPGLSRSSQRIPVKSGQSRKIRNIRSTQRFY
jgi:hypothetical protein